MSSMHRHHCEVIMIKLWLPIAAGATIVGLGLYSWGLSSRIDLAQAERDTARAESKSLNDLLTTERDNLAQAQQRAIDYQSQRDKSDEQNQAYRDCIANKSCGVRVHVEYRTVRDPNTGTCAVIEADAESQRELEQNYLSLDRELRLMEDNYQALQKELVVRSDKDYCKVKKIPQ